MSRRSSTRLWAGWLLCSLAGTVLIALPDPDNRLFSISEGHGPGALDLVGALLLIAGWTALDVVIWLGRRRLVHMGRRRIVLLATVALAGAVLVGWSVEQDAGNWWLLGVALLAGAQLVAAHAATDWDRHRRPLKSAGVDPLSLN